MDKLVLTAVDRKTERWYIATSEYWQNRFAELAKQRLQLDQEAEQAKAQEAEFKKQKELRDTDPFQNRKQSFSAEYRTFLLDRIQNYIKYQNLFTADNRTSLKPMSKGTCRVRTRRHGRTEPGF